MAKFEVSDKELENINGGVKIKYAGMNLDITPDVIHDAWESGNSQTYIGLLKGLGFMFKKEIKQLYSEYANPKTNPNGYIMPSDLDSALQNILN